MKRFHSNSPMETAGFGKAFAASLQPGDVVAIMGDLGTGKTQFVTGICDALGARGHVGSPTFTLINEYPAPFGAVVHVDMYRLNAREEIRELGLEEYFNTQFLCLIEWAGLILDFLPRRHHTVRMAHSVTDHERDITVFAPEEDPA